MIKGRLNILAPDPKGSPAHQGRLNASTVTPKGSSVHLDVRAARHNVGIWQLADSIANKPTLEKNVGLIVVYLFFSQI